MRGRRLPVWGSAFPFLAWPPPDPPLAPPLSSTARNTHVHTHTRRTSLPWDSPLTPPELEEGHTHTHTQTHIHTGSGGGRAATAVWGCLDRQEDTGSWGRQMPGRTQAGAQSPGTHHPSGFGGLGRKWGGAHDTQAGGSGSIQTDRPLPPSTAAALTDTPPLHQPSPRHPDTQILTGQLADARETPGGRADPPRPTPLGWALVAGGGCGWRVVAVAAAWTWSSRSGRDSHTRSALAHTLTWDAINIQSPSALPGDPRPPLLASLGTPPPARAGGRGRPPHPAPSLCLPPGTRERAKNKEGGGGAGRDPEPA